MKKIMIIEDDEFLRLELQNILQKAGYKADFVSDFDAIMEKIMMASPDLILLDLNLPQQSGFEICRDWKSKSMAPILILTSRDKLQDEIQALNLGADDYLTKPCHPERLLARIKKLMNLYGNMRPLLNGGWFQLDKQTNILYVGKQQVCLSETEKQILQLLIEKSPSVVAKETFLFKLWGSADYVDENILQVNIARLRKKIEVVGLDHSIQTVKGQGYRLDREVRYEGI